MKISTTSFSDGRRIDTYQYWKVSINMDTFFWYRSIPSYRYLGFSVYLKNREFSGEKHKIFL